MSTMQQQHGRAADTPPAELDNAQTRVHQVRDKVHNKGSADYFAAWPQAKLAKYAEEAHTEINALRSDLRLAIDAYRRAMT